MTIANTILILTAAEDLHGFTVEQALIRKGAPVRRWLGPTFGEDDWGTIKVANDSPLSLDLVSPKWSLSAAEVSTVWARRPVFPEPGDHVHAFDRQQVKQELSLFVQSAWWALSESAHWVNPYGCRRYVKSKAMQLETARREGLSIPPTLYSNDPAAIREYFRARGGNGIIYKPHRISEWKEDGARHLLHTAIIANIDQFSDEELRLCPGIFQWNVPKAYELRINVMGSHVVAVKIASQDVEAGRTDWRSARPAELALEPYELPAEIRTKCRRLLDRLGVVFGIVDMIVTPGGDYVFLEVNEMGQFLWIEAANPEIRLLDHFCSFLMSGSAGYHGEITGPPISYGELLSDDALSSEFRHQRDTVRRPDYSVEWIDLLV